MTADMQSVTKEVRCTWKIIIKLVYVCLYRVKNLQNRTMLMVMNKAHITLWLVSAYLTSDYYTNTTILQLSGLCLGQPRWAGTGRNIHPLIYRGHQSSPWLYVCVYVCVSVSTLKEKRLELSTPNLVHVCSMAGPWHALIQRSKGQGHRIMKHAAGVGLHVNVTAYLF